MKTTIRLAGLLAAATLTACSAYSTRPAAPAMVSEGVLTSSSGMTLYTFDRDTAGSGKSACNGPCTANWPPLLATEGAMGSGDFSLITREDGKQQWAFKGKPLYHWAKDQKPGDRTGDGFNNLWHAARP
ncbi:MAG TPA: hypothetical protein VFK74_07760 [Azospira sp.]|nr:hypothetical protein [Azospira sp.]